MSLRKRAAKSLIARRAFFFPPLVRLNCTACIPACDFTFPKFNRSTVYFRSFTLSHRIFLRMKNARPCDFCSRSAGFIRVIARFQRKFSADSAQIMPSQRIFSVKVSVTAYSSHRKYPPTVVFPQIGGCFTFSAQKYVLRIKDSPHPQSHLSTT